MGAFEIGKSYFFDRRNIAGKKTFLAKMIHANIYKKKLLVQPFSRKDNLYFVEEKIRFFINKK